MIVAAFSPNISLGNLITMAVVIAGILALAWVYARKESGAVWRSVAEGLEEKVKLLTEKVAQLSYDLEIEKAKPNQELLVSLVSQSIGRMGAVTKNLQDLSEVIERQKTMVMESANALKDELVDQREDSALAMKASIASMQSFGVLLDDMRKEVVMHDEQALERHDAIMVELRRPPTARTRVTDVA